jgi:hypothetical protein
VRNCAAAISLHVAAAACAFWAKENVSTATAPNTTVTASIAAVVIVVLFVVLLVKFIFSRQKEHYG